MVRKTKEETQNTRSCILKAALDCFYEKGFSKTSFDDIAAKIGMTKGAVYWHFKDKAELLAELIKVHIKEKSDMLRAQQSAGNYLSNLRNFFIREAEYIENHTEIQKFIFFVMAQVEWSDVIFNAVIAKLGDIRNFHLENIQNALTMAQKSGEIAPNINIAQIALIIANLWRGSVHFYVTDKQLSSQSLAESFICGLDLILNQLKEGQPK